MKSTPKVPVGITLMAIGYKCNSSKVLGFIATEGAGSTEPGDPYLYCLTDIYSSVSVHPSGHPHLIYRYSNDCNATDNHNKMRKSDLAL